MILKDILFVHGGPGMNSNPERRLLARPLSDAHITYHFWDEPSTFRPTGLQFTTDSSYKSCLESIDMAMKLYKPKVLIGGSFGAQTCLDYVRNYHTDSNLKLLFICPTFDIYKTIFNMMMISENDFKDTDPEKYSLLKNIRKNVSSFWDEDMKMGLDLAWQNPKLPSYYFVNQNILKMWFNALSEPEYTPDPVSQDSVFCDFKNFKSQAQILNRNVTVLKGEKDPVWNQGENTAVLKSSFLQFSEIEFKDTAHFPHLEDPQRFIKLIETLIS